MRRSALIPCALSDRSEDGSFGQPLRILRDGVFSAVGRAGCIEAPGDPKAPPGEARPPRHPSHPPAPRQCTALVGERGVIMGAVQGYGDKFSADCCKGLAGLRDFGWRGGNLAWVTTPTCLFSTAVIPAQAGIQCRVHGCPRVLSGFPPSRE